MLRFSLGILVFAGGILAAHSASAAAFASGDIFASIGGGQVAVYSSSGTLLQTLNTGAGGYTTGSTTDQSGNFYVTNFSNGSVSEFNNSGALTGTFASGYSNPEFDSLQQDRHGLYR